MHACICRYRLLTGNPPFWSPNTQDMFAAISNVDYKMPDTLSPGAYPSPPHTRPAYSRPLQLRSGVLISSHIRGARLHSEDIEGRSGQQALVFQARQAPLD